VKPLPYSLRQLQYAVAVADTGGFRRAAERCHVSQPSLSGQLALLEKSLGVRLFERDRRRVIVTAAGEALIARARAILTGAQDLAVAGRDFAEPFAGTWRLGVIPTIAPYMLPGLVPGLRARYPALTLLWAEEKTPPLLAELRAGRLDAGILARVAGMDDLEQAALLNDPFVLAGPREHPLLTSRKPLTPEDLEGELVLLLDDGHCFRDQALALCRRSHAQDAGVRATSLATLAQMAAGGAGLTLLPELAVPVENRRGGLALRRFVAPAPSRSLVLAWRRASPLRAAFKDFAGELRALAAGERNSRTVMKKRS
jgi:LysR family transcriptional regulator, hydrogen peroxide-inducible genes activator